MRLLLIVVIFMFLSRWVFAATDVNEVISSGTIGGMTVTTGTSIRVDNKYGNSTTIIDPRVGVEIQRLDPLNEIFCGYYSQVSTAIGNIYVGKRIAAGGLYYKALIRGGQWWCKAVDAAGVGGVRISVDQMAKQ